MRYTLVTGGAGFIGSHLADALLAAGESVLVLDDLSTGRDSNIAHLRKHPRFELLRASINDPEALESAVAGAEAIYHLAAAVGVRRVLDEPLTSLETNVLGTHEVLKAASARRIPTLIASSSDVYGRAHHQPVEETDELAINSRPRWAYGCGKAIDEFFAQAFATERHLPVVSARLFNVIGPRQTGRYGMVLPRFIDGAVNGDTLDVYGDGQQTRSFCHVRDVVAALRGLLEHAETLAGQAFNVGNPEEISIAALARRILGQVGVLNPDNRIRFVPFAQAFSESFEEPMRRVPSIERIREAVGWQPTVSLDESIAELIRERLRLQSSLTVKP